jgi:hypothetical protein
VRSMKLRYVLEDHWPRLAWLAQVHEGEPLATVRHGQSVETRDDWFCEAVWDGRFEHGDLDRTDIVAGSGGRLRPEGLMLVSSGSTVDRLQWCRRGRTYWISNSLPCLLSATGDAFDPAYPHFYRDFLSIIKGLRRYRRALPTRGGGVQLTYFQNLCWNGVALSEVTKPGHEREFRRFEEYRRFLQSSLDALAENMRSPGRGYRLEFLATLSAGYDSPTVVALARRAGLERVICFRRSEPRDRGADIAHLFGVEPIEVPVDAWRDLDRPEIPFIAANCFGEDVHYSAAETHLAGKVLLTGNLGGKVWSKHNKQPSPDLERLDLSGLSLTEYRLRVGFLHCAVPFFGARQAGHLKAISNAPEMRPWDVGGNYTRPICRRIVEESGVPREAFGVSKSFAARWHFRSPDFLSEAGLRDYLEWLREHRGAWWRRGRPAPLRDIRLDQRRLALLEGLGAALASTPGIYRLHLGRFPPLARLIAYGDPNAGCAPLILGLRRYVFPWAAARAARAFAR